ncbi:PGF-pre-PGF domain-containing protein [Methanococcoides sp. SA1]|nr:PGF-pre-PGF domain-containing protein [Methanococcoides sp. SA1]
MKIKKLIFNLGIIFLILLSTGISYATDTDVQNNSVDAYFKAEYTSAFESISQMEYSKSSMTDAQQKLSTDLLKLINKNDPDEELKITELQMDTPAQFSTTNFISRNLDSQIPDDLVYAYIYLNPSSKIENIEPYVWSITDRDAKNKIAVAWVEVGNLEKLAGIGDVRNIRTVLPPEMRKGSFTTEGDAIHRTDLVRTIHSYNGTGMKIGVISDGVDSWESARAFGDLPNITVLSNVYGGDEGTAMLEIIHDMVPGAELYFHDLGGNQLAFNSGIDALVDAGCDVIVDDVGWLLEPFFEDGVVASHIADVIANNDVIYVSSAGNSADRHYQGDYSDDGTDFHNKSFDLTFPPNGKATIILQWDDNFGSSGNDYDLYLFDKDNGDVLEISNKTQNGDDDPLEYFGINNYDNSTYNTTIKIKNYNNSAAKTLELYIFPSNGTLLSSNNFTAADSIFGHPAVPDVVAVGAVRATTPETIESFSSQGPVTISYPSQVLRSKPDIVGIDGVSITGAGGFPNPFYGTSASAPHVAAIAAQIWSAVPDKKADEIREILYSSAIDLGDTGFDNVYGYGRADALNAYNETTNPPLFSNEFPLNGSYTNNNNTNVVVNITDGGSGLNLNAFNMIINGSSVVFTNTTIDNGYRIENMTSQPYSDGIINVSVTAENNFSVSATYLWSFIVDATKPTSTKPEDIEFSANSTANFTYWKLFDLHPEYYWVLLNGTEVVSPQQWTNDTNLSIPVNTSIGLGDFNYTIQYNDTAGNYGDPDTVMININDTSSPYAFGNIPANGSYINDTRPSIYINVADNASGVNKSSISMMVNGTEVDFTNTSISKGYNISNVTTMDFAHNQAIDVIVNATDNNSNFMSHSWAFTIDREDPTIDITSHLDGSSTISESVIISGIANGTGSPASVTVNSVETAFEGQNGTFTQTTPLSLGTNRIYANVTDSAGNFNTTSINITRTSPPTSKSSGGGGGGGGTTGEAYENIQKKEVISQFVIKGDEISYEFEEGENAIDKIRFDALKNSGKISVTVEVLKERSSQVDKDPEGKVYRHMNIWVGKTGFATEQNIADPVIGFRVNNSWINDNNINESTIILNRYHDDEWNRLTTTKTGVGEGYLYFEAKTPGFSPFAITGEENEAPIVTKEPAKMISSTIEDGNSNGNAEVPSTNQIGIPTFLSKITLVVGVLILLLIYFKRKYLLRKLKRIND